MVFNNIGITALLTNIECRIPSRLAQGLLTTLLNSPLKYFLQHSSARRNKSDLEDVFMYSSSFPSLRQESSMNSGYQTNCNVSDGCVMFMCDYSSLYAG